MAKAAVGAKYCVMGFSYEKETPGTYRFQETGEKDSRHIGRLYVKKSAFPKGPPKELKVTVEAIG